MSNEHSGFSCPRCHEVFSAYFLYLRHAREQHGERPAPLSSSGSSPVAERKSS